VVGRYFTPQHAGGTCVGCVTRVDGLWGSGPGLWTACGVSRRVCGIAAKVRAVAPGDTKAERGVAQATWVSPGASRAERRAARSVFGCTPCNLHVPGSWRQGAGGRRAMRVLHRAKPKANEEPLRRCGCHGVRQVMSERPAVRDWSLPMQLAVGGGAGRCRLLPDRDQRRGPQAWRAAAPGTTASAPARPHPGHAD
jgi:hypothetical protein